MAKSFNFSAAPGHLIRRAQQLAVGIFMEETASFDATPVQFAILHALIDAPGEDQITLSSRVAFDPATFGSVIGRLELKGWVKREPDPADRRRKLLWTTPVGEAVAINMKGAVRAAQQRIVAPLDPDERVQLGRLLAKLVAGHEQAENDAQSFGQSARLGSAARLVKPANPAKPENGTTTVSTTASAQA